MGPMARRCENKRASQAGLAREARTQILRARFGTKEKLMAGADGVEKLEDGIVRSAEQVAAQVACGSLEAERGGGNA